MTPVLNPELAGYYKDEQGRKVRVTRKFLHKDQRVWIEYRLVSTKANSTRLLKGLHRGFTDQNVTLYETEQPNAD